MMPATFSSCTGKDILMILPELARLRIAVFREYPYLYQGSEEYERRYLEHFAAAKDSVAVTANVGGAVVGCATGCALADSHEEFVAPLAEARFNVEATFYLAESVLLPEFRGRGFGHVFFDRREAHASERGYKQVVFAAVVRASDYFARPGNFMPLDGFWRKRGYAPLHGVTACFRWLELGHDRETEHTMQYWIRTLPS
jgi:GNAT superfamily N-acetyltransferase